MYLEPMIDDIRDFKHDASGQDLVVFLLGGMSKGLRVKSWMPTSRSRLQPTPSLDTITHCCAFEVARFLQSIRGERAKVWRSISGNIPRRSQSHSVHGSRSDVGLIAEQGGV